MGYRVMLVTKSPYAAQIIVRDVYEALVESMVGEMDQEIPFGVEMGGNVVWFDTVRQFLKTITVERYNFKNGRMETLLDGKGPADWLWDVAVIMSNRRLNDLGW